jgi:small-conductance mechanosensitive channel
VPGYQGESHYSEERVMEKVLVVVVLIISFTTILMTFEKIRQFGASLLASAGIVGIILGFAAQKSIAALFAGLQIAITQPIRIDDVVIVENEWGWIEEINL